MNTIALFSQMGGREILMMGCGVQVVLLVAAGFVGYAIGKSAGRREAMLEQTMRPPAPPEQHRP